MMSSEETVFEAIRSALGGLEEKTPLPDYDPAMLVAEGRLEGGSLQEVFGRNFRAVNGTPLSRTADLIALLEEGDFGFGYCDPTLGNSVGRHLEEAGLEVVYEFDRDRHNEYRFGITVATGAIAESGTVILNDFETSDRLAALSPWVHIAVLERAEKKIHRTLPEALAALGDCPNVVWATGPSKTADIEGILVEGVHGPGVQICLCIDSY